MKYNDMIVENVASEDLPKFAKLLGDDTILMYDDICFEHSKYCMDENGEVTAFIILRQHSLYDYFGGVIPLDRNFKRYETHIRDVVSQYCPEEYNHFEIIFCYLKDKEYSIHLHNLYVFTHTFDNGMPIGVVWTKYQNLLEFSLKSHFYNFNDDIWIDLPFDD